MEIGGTVDGFIRIVPVDILVPVIEQERYALLMLCLLYTSLNALDFLDHHFGEQVKSLVLAVRSVGILLSVTGHNPY